MTPTEMRAALAQKKPANVLDALRLCFDREPTEFQEEQATVYGGLHDQRTIDSIPDQVEAWRNGFQRMYPGIVLTDDQVFPRIQPFAFDAARMVNLSDRYIQSMIDGYARSWFLSLEWDTPDALFIKSLFLLTHKRLPVEGRGLAAYVAQIKAGRSLAVIAAEIEGNAK